MKKFLHHPSLTISEADYRMVDSSWSRRTFVYPHNRLYYVSAGQAKIVLMDRCITLKEGYIYLLPAFMMEATICDHSFTHHYVHFHIDSLEFMTYLSYGLPQFYMRVHAPQLTTALFELIIDTYKHNSIASDLSCQGALQVLLAPFFSQESSGHNQRIQRFEQVLQYIELNLDQAITIDDLAEILSLEKVYFSNLFTKTFAIPPRQYINKRRLNRSQLLLINTDKRVKEIALEVGFENESYFSRLFHSKIGMTPGSYRKMT